MIRVRVGVRLRVRVRVRVGVGVRVRVRVRVPCRRARLVLLHVDDVVGEGDAEAGLLQVGR